MAESTSMQTTYSRTADISEKILRHGLITEGLLLLMGLEWVNSSELHELGKIVMTYSAEFMCVNGPAWLFSYLAKHSYDPKQTLISSADVIPSKKNSFPVHDYRSLTKYITNEDRSTDKN